MDALLYAEHCSRLRRIDRVSSPVLDGTNVWNRMLASETTRCHRLLLDLPRHLRRAHSYSH